VTLALIVEKVSGRAYGYLNENGTWVLRDQSAASALLGDGGIYSSVEDLAKWDRALYGTRLVSAKTWQEAVTPGMLNGGKPTEYGFGRELGAYNGHRTWSHGGGPIGFTTYIARFPDDRVTVILLMHRTDLNPRKTAYAIAGLYLGGGQ